jgi:cytochrome P450
MDAEAYRNKTVPSAGSLYEEAQALLFAGTDTVGNAMMVGTHHLLKHPETMQKLKAELQAAWPSLENDGPRLRELENLPYLNAVIKEALRLSSGVISGLLRVVPPAGATITGAAVPAGVSPPFASNRFFRWLTAFQTIVSCGSTFVHNNAAIFPEPEKFIPERWLESPELDNWLIAFSRGPRMCLGIK